MSFARAHRADEMAITARDDDAEAFACRRCFVVHARAFHGLTAVAAEHRRRGIGRAMKTRQLEAARHAGITHVTTGNDVTNVAALAMNASLGYRPTRIDRELRLVP
jgi:GNAT superfamily N-acetyltransferase